MGHGLLPFKDEESAWDFLEDHQGQKILLVQDVTEEKSSNLWTGLLDRG